MRIPIGILAKFQRVWCRYEEIGQKPLFWDTFWGFLKYSKDEKEL
jgi:hypothetical protein